MHWKPSFAPPPAQPRTSLLVERVCTRNSERRPEATGRYALGLSACEIVRFAELNVGEPVFRNTVRCAVPPARARRFVAHFLRFVAHRSLRTPLRFVAH